MEMHDWEIFLLLALWCDEHQQASAEHFFIKALSQAEEQHGKSSLAVGSVLIEFAEFLEKQGRQVEADAYEGRLHKIVLVHSANLVRETIAGRN
jgi:hypothetical protein